MKEYTMEDAYQDSLLKWEFLSEHDFENPIIGNKRLVVAFPRLRELNNYCGFCHYNMDSRGKLNCKGCILSGGDCYDSTCCEGRFNSWYNTPEKHYARDVLNFIKEKYSEYVISNTKKEEEKPRDILHDFGKEHGAEIHDNNIVFSSENVIDGINKVSIMLRRSGTFKIGCIDADGDFNNENKSLYYYPKEIDWLTHTLAIISEYVP